MEKKGQCSLSTEGTSKPQDPPGHRAAKTVSIWHFFPYDEIELICSKNMHRKSAKSRVKTEKTGSKGFSINELDKYQKKCTNMFLSTKK